MAELSPAARAVLAAVTQAQYTLDPEDVPYEAARISTEVAAALRAAADHGRLDPEHLEGTLPDDYERGWNAALEFVSSIAAELDPTTTEITND